MTTTEPSRKRKRVSKNKKKNWRKTDIKDVEEYLEGVRIQERTGGLAEEKSNEQLFIVDTTKTDIEEAIPAKRSRREPKPLKCHAGLNPYPLIKPFRVTTNTRKDSAKKLCAAKRNKSELSATEKKSLEYRQVARKELKDRRILNRKLKKSDDFDLWGEKDINSKPEDLEEYFAVKTRKTRIAVPVTAKQKRSGLKAVETPHPGQSYNPSFEEHQNVLRDALTVEVKKVKAEAKVKRALDDAFPARGSAPNEASYIQEMSAGIFEDEDASDTEVTAKDLEAISVNPPVRRENKKTEKQRRKMEAVKLRAKTRLQAKDDKIFEKEMSRLKSVGAEVRKGEVQHAEKMARKKQMQEANKDRTRKLGKLKYEEPDIEIKLSDEIEGSLRLLKPEGNLLEDRWKSLQKRNILEPRQRQKVVRKYKKKKVEKKSHKSVSV